MKKAFEYVGLNWQDYVVSDPMFYRPSEVHLLQGDFSKAAERLQWQPTMDFSKLIRLMVDEDLNDLKRV
ncbi:MAG: GDP-mannose 4,6-dehydratase [Sedimentisphaerales bacterium]